jgi:hypothetical protein
MNRSVPLLYRPAREALACGSRAYDRFVSNPVALYGSAVLRIGYALLYFAYLVHEMRDVQRLWGPSAPWTPQMDHTLAAQAGWAGWIQAWYTLLAVHSAAFVQVFYFVSLAVCLLFALGWRTRALAVCFMIAVTAFQGRSVFITDGGDNVEVLMSIYLAFTACGRRWSLDARRIAKRADRAGAPARAARLASRWGAWSRRSPALAGNVIAAGQVRRQIVTVTHNCAVLIIAYQMCVIYAAAAMLKIQGSMWQDGTALYYALHLSWFAPWPGVSAWLASHSMIIAITTYLTVFVQLGLPFAVFGSKIKYVMVATLISLHLGILIFLGLPTFSLAMIIGDLIFLPDSVWQRAGTAVHATLGRRLPGRSRRRRLDETPQSRHPVTV